MSAARITASIAHIRSLTLVSGGAACCVGVVMSSSRGRSIGSERRSLRTLFDSVEPYDANNVRVKRCSSRRMLRDMSAAPVSRRARPAKAPLSREAIIETGLRILDRDGSAALTMRRVAQHLDTGSASLYVYVANRDALMAAMLDHVLGTVPEPAGDTWHDRLTTL